MIAANGAGAARRNRAAVAQAALAQRQHERHIARIAERQIIRELTRQQLARIELARNGGLENVPHHRDSRALRQERLRRELSQEVARHMANDDVPPPNHERKQQQGLVGAAEGAGYTREYQWRGAMP
eukprot:COSAG05_NODE_4473_length_1479_cov_10.030021_3_plen_126_part_01